MAFGTHSSRAPGRQSQPSPLAIPQTRNTKVTRAFADWKGYAGTLGLTPSQARFAETFFSGTNTHLAGEGGSGKSYLTQALITFLTARGINVGVTATTGVSAFLIGGQTLHSFCGIGIADEPVYNLVVKVRKNSRARERIKAIDVLFIDEISMAKGDLLDKVDGVFRSIRHSTEPFGGCQVCMVGDGLQLAPVFKGDEVQQLAFQCEAWTTADVKTVILKEQMRQRGDATFLKILNELRVGCTDNLALINERVGATFPDDGVGEPVRIYCTNAAVDVYNTRRMATLTGMEKTYVARDSGLPHHIDAFNRNCPAPAELKLKVGAQVLCLVNQDVKQGVCNGSVGVIKAFGPQGVTVRFKTTTAIIELNTWELKEQEVGVDGKIKMKVVATRTQMPLKVCYSQTAHRVQGQTLERAIVDISDAFSDGQTYCALSRVRDMESLSLAAPIPARAVRANPACLAFYEAAEEFTL